MPIIYPIHRWTFLYKLVLTQKSHKLHGRNRYRDEDQDYINTSKNRDSTIEKVKLRIMWKKAEKSRQPLKL
jgi:hypothetical protein